MLQPISHGVRTLTNSFFSNSALKAVAEAPSDPNESVGVWVSGFFGSGKSSFAKNLGYALENRAVLGSKFADLFKQQLGDTRTGDLLDLINAKTPTQVISWAKSVLPMFTGDSSEKLRIAPDQVQIDTTHFRWQAPARSALSRTLLTINRTPVKSFR